MLRRSVWTLGTAGPIEGHGFGPFSPPDDCARSPPTRWRCKRCLTAFVPVASAAADGPVRRAVRARCRRRHRTTGAARSCPAPRSAPPWGMASSGPCRPALSLRLPCRMPSRRWPRSATGCRRGLRRPTPTLRAALRSPDLRQVRAIGRAPHARSERASARQFRSIAMKSILLAAVLALVANAASAHEYKAGSIEIKHPWARATPKGADGRRRLHEDHQHRHRARPADRRLDGRPPANSRSTRCRWTTA